MCGKIVSAGIGKAVEDILGEVPAEDRAEAIEEIRTVLNREMFGLLTDIPDIRCPKCGCADHMKNGHTRIGTQRYMCKECGNTYCNIEGGMIIRNTKLDNSKWMAFAECFIDGLSCKRTAEKIRVTPRTAWFMRVRTLEALQKNLPSFEVKADSGADIDEIFFPESFKGISFKNLGRMPREPRREGHGTRTRGISNEQICVVTGINDNGDMFYDVACRGRLDRTTAMRTLESRISDGVMINTDRHNAYPEVLFKLGTAFHNAYSSSDHKSLERINDLHSSIRGFMRKFKGVSTKWLHCYLAWFKWLGVRPFRCRKGGYRSRTDPVRRLRVSVEGY